MARVRLLDRIARREYESEDVEAETENHFGRN